jgi:hypothetical protein
MTAEQLMAVIERAFAGVVFPNTISLRQTRLLDNWERGGTQFQRALEDDHTGDWRDVPDADIKTYGDTYFAYSDGPSARYYLPAFLCYCLRHWKKADSTLCWVLFYLGRGPAIGLHHPEDLLSPHQKAAVEAFLQFTAECARSRGDADEAELALLNYWSEFREGSFYAAEDA